MSLQNSLSVPIYVIDPHRVFPEVPSAKQLTSDATRPVASLVIFVAYMLSGVGLTGVYADTPMEQIDAEISAACEKYNVDKAFVFEWAESLLLPVGATFTAEEREKFIPKFIKSKGWSLREYQWLKAAWCAYRKGSIMALGCGLGKSGTSTAAAIGAANAGRCQKTRCHIIAPLNAMPQWDPYIEELRGTFDEVVCFSMDSAHNYVGLQRGLGGAVIFDELHKLKSDDSRRGDACETLRNAYEWSVGLTGTLFHTGAEGVLRVQDLVLPGLSRFLNKWKFGDVFESTYEKKVGKRTRRTIGMPADAQFDRFTEYMSRGVCSLSFESPEVKDAVQMPGRNSITVDSWETPLWARERLVEIAKQDSRNRLYWAPDWMTNEQTTQYMGALALAMSEFEPERKLPSFPKVMHAACTEGRVNRVITKIYPEGKGDPQFKFEYEPGLVVDVHNVDTLPPGPKIAQVEQWLKENPKEPMILSSVGNLGMYMLAQLLVKYDVKFEIIRGDVDKKERKRIVEEFEEGKFRVCLLQQAAGAESITLVRATTSILIDHHWSSSIYTQFMARNYRIGQTEFCEHYDYQFGTMQGQVIRRLRRGELFDARVRSQLESTYWNTSVIQVLKA